MKRNPSPGGVVSAVEPGTLADQVGVHPGDVILELIGPSVPPAEPRPGFIAGLAFEVVGIDALTAALKARGLPVGEPHLALQGGRIVSVNASGTCGVPVAFIDFSDSPR